MSAAKLQFSPEETRLVTDPGVILTKNSVMTKVVAMMAGLSTDYRDIYSGEGAEPKISRGENYQGLPWVMLDQPRLFGKEDVFAIRTFFWWGHGFSVTLHVKGIYREKVLPVVQQRWAELAAAGFQMGISADEWRHEHVPENYAAVSGAADLVRGDLEFLKLSSAVGLHRWEHVPEDLLRLFKTLISVLF